MWTPATQPSGPVTYTPDPPWDGGSACRGGYTAGARELGAALRSWFPCIREVQGYNCRPNSALPSRMSSHGTGRAIDLMVDVGDPRGNEVADWLVQNATELGVQLVIWDRTIWSVANVATGSHRPYTGPSSHRDHLHVELNDAGSSGGRIYPQQERSSATAVPMIAVGVALIAAGSAAIWFSGNMRSR